MEPGDVVRMRNFRHYTGEKLGIQTLDYTAPAGQVFIAVLLGIEPKDEPFSQEPSALLEKLGWRFDDGSVAARRASHPVEGAAPAEGGNDG